MGGQLTPTEGHSPGRRAWASKGDTSYLDQLTKNSSPITFQPMMAARFLGTRLGWIHTWAWRAMRSQVIAGMGLVDIWGVSSMSRWSCGQLALTETYSYRQVLDTQGQAGMDHHRLQSRCDMHTCSTCFSGQKPHSWHCPSRVSLLWKEWHCHSIALSPPSSHWIIFLSRYYIFQISFCSHLGFLNQWFCWFLLLLSTWLQGSFQLFSPMTHNTWHTPSKDRILVVFITESSLVQVDQ